jgi:hypothetical protein
LSRGAGKEASGAGGRGKGKNSVGSNSNTSIFNFADAMGEGNAHMARLLVLYLYNQEKVAPVGPLGCVQLRCSTYDRTYFTPVPFVECLDTRAVLSLDTGRLFVRTKSGLTVFFDMKRCIWRSAEFSWPLNQLGVDDQQWDKSIHKPWLAFPWGDPGVVRVNVSGEGLVPSVSVIFFFKHLFDREMQKQKPYAGPLVGFRPFIRCHGHIDLTMGNPVPKILNRLHLGLRFLPAEELWRQRTVALFLAHHPRAGSLSRIRVLDVETLRRIMQMEKCSTASVHTVSGIDGGIPFP